MRCVRTYGNQNISIQVVHLILGHWCYLIICFMLWMRNDQCQIISTQFGQLILETYGHFINYLRNLPKLYFLADLQINYSYAIFVIPYPCMVLHSKQVREQMNCTLFIPFEKSAPQNNPVKPPKIFEIFMIFCLLLDINIRFLRHTEQIYEAFQINKEKKPYQDQENRNRRLDQREAQSK